MRRLSALFVAGIALILTFNASFRLEAGEGIAPSLSPRNRETPMQAEAAKATAMASRHARILRLKKDAWLTTEFLMTMTCLGICLRNRPLSGNVHRRARRAGRIFVTCSAVTLLATALLKLMNVRQGGPVLALQEPLLGLSYRSVFLLSAGTEIAVAIVALVAADVRHQLLAITWMAASFTLYRIGLSTIGYTAPCQCLGTVTEGIGIDPRSADQIARWLAWSMCSGGFALLLLTGKGRA
jgi:hypothetical protein